MVKIVLIHHFTQELESIQNGQNTQVIFNTEAIPAKECHSFCVYFQLNMARDWAPAFPTWNNSENLKYTEVQNWELILDFINPKELKVKCLHTWFGASQENGSKASRVTIQGDIVVPENIKNWIINRIIGRLVQLIT